MYSNNLKAIECVFCLVGMQIYSIYGLLYPASSVIQLVGSISVPVTDLAPQRRILFDWGFQMNYDMPFNVSSFYNIPIWSAGKNSTARIIRNAAIQSSSVHARDFSSVELYKATENILERFGFHKSCLLIAICDVMQFPFDIREENIVSELLTFFLKPTNHMILRKAKSKEVEAYLLAELRGYMGLNCTKVYMNCTENPLNLFSIINSDYISF